MMNEIDFIGSLRSSDILKHTWPSAIKFPMYYVLCPINNNALKTVELSGPCEARRKNPHLNRAKFRLRVFCLGLGGLTQGRIYS